MTQRKINCRKISVRSSGRCPLCPGPRVHGRPSGLPSQQEKEIFAESWSENCLYKPLQQAPWWPPENPQFTTKWPGDQSLAQWKTWIPLPSVEKNSCKATWCLWSWMVCRGFSQCPLCLYVTYVSRKMSGMMVRWEELQCHMVAVLCTPGDKTIQCGLELKCFLRGRLAQ